MCNLYCNRSCTLNYSLPISNDQYYTVAMSSSAHQFQQSGGEEDGIESGASSLPVLSLDLCHERWQAMCPKGRQQEMLWEGEREGGERRERRKFLKEEGKRKRRGGGGKVGGKEITTERYGRNNSYV